MLLTAFFPQLTENGLAIALSNILSQFAIVGRDAREIILL
jgi:hypothetical protein